MIQAADGKIKGIIMYKLCLFSISPSLGGLAQVRLTPQSNGFSHFSVCFKENNLIFTRF